MTDNAFIIFLAVVVFIVGFLFGGIAGDSTGRNNAREKFLTFCTDQGLSYAQCKEEWTKR